MLVQTLLYKRKYFWRFDAYLGLYSNDTTLRISVTGVTGSIDQQFCLLLVHYLIAFLQRIRLEKTLWPIRARVPTRSAPHNRISAASKEKKSCVTPPRIDGCLADLLSLCLKRTHTKTQKQYKLSPCNHFWRDDAFKCVERVVHNNNDDVAYVANFISLLLGLMCYTLNSGQKVSPKYF